MDGTPNVEEKDAEFADTTTPESRGEELYLDQREILQQQIETALTQLDELDDLLLITRQRRSLLLYGMAGCMLLLASIASIVIIHPMIANRDIDEVFYFIERWFIPIVLLILYALYNSFVGNLNLIRQSHRLYRTQGRLRRALEAAAETLHAQK